MSEKFAYDVFISYSSQDKAIVHPLAERLRDDGVKVWLDAWVLKPGDPISLKIQQGLEKSRVLLMCMSKAYFASDWTTLEHHTLLFRDPTNEKRRFVPLLLEDCDRPDVIAQFLHIDWRGKAETSYKSLLAACASLRPSSSATETPGASSNISVYSDTLLSSLEINTETPRGLNSFAVTSDGRLAVTGSKDIYKVWDLEKSCLIGMFEPKNGTTQAVAIHPDDKRVVSGSQDGPINPATK